MCYVWKLAGYIYNVHINVHYGIYWARRSVTLNFGHPFFVSQIYLVNTIKLNKFIRLYFLLVKLYLLLVSCVFILTPR